MPYLKYREKNVYYEVIGDGNPLLILNGIMMSTNSWTLFKEEFSRNNQVIFVDFLDQGRTDKLIDMEYSHEIQVDLIKALLEALKIEKINIMGISYGGEVALSFTVKYKECVDKLILANTAGRTNPWLKEIGDGWNLSTREPMNYYATTIPVIYSPEFYNQNIQWMEKRKKVLTTSTFANKEFMDSMTRLTNSAAGYDVLEELKNITAKTLIISSECDYLTPMSEQKLLNKGILNSELVILPGTGHASMYERPVVFAALVLGFLNLSTHRFYI